MSVNFVLNNIIFNDKLPENDDVINGSIYISEKLCMSKHRCFCGCNKIILSVDDSPNMDLVVNKNKTITFNNKFFNMRLECQSIYSIKENIVTIYK